MYFFLFLKSMGLVVLNFIAYKLVRLVAVKYCLTVALAPEVRSYSLLGLGIFVLILTSFVLWKVSKEGTVFLSKVTKITVKVLYFIWMTALSISIYTCLYIFLNDQLFTKKEVYSKYGISLKKMHWSLGELVSEAKRFCLKNYGNPSLAEELRIDVNQLSYQANADIDLFRTLLAEKVKERLVVCDSYLFKFLSWFGAQPGLTYEEYVNQTIIMVGATVGTMLAILFITNIFLGFIGANGISLKPAVTHEELLNKLTEQQETNAQLRENLDVVKQDRNNTLLRLVSLSDQVEEMERDFEERLVAKSDVIQTLREENARLQYTLSQYYPEYAIF